MLAVPSQAVTVDQFSTHSHAFTQELDAETDNGTTLIADQPEILSSDKFCSRPEPLDPRSLVNLHLPNNDWKTFSHLVDDHEKIFLAELIFTRSGSFYPRKCIEVNTEERTVIFRVKDHQITSNRLPVIFTSIESLEQLLKLFNDMALCTGIATGKYRVLSGLAIPSGSFVDGTWRSNG